MKKKMLINVADEEESRVAIVEDGILEEFTIETTSKEQIKGNIYNGVIVKVEPSLQAAFVDYGGKRHGFLPMGEIQPSCYTTETRGEDRDRRPRIQDVLKRNHKVLVQVVKEELGNKGASLSTYISLPGRYLVLMPGSESGGGISRKIEDEEERKKLKEIVTQLNPPPDIGVIVRTAGLNRNKAELQRDMTYLQRLWASIEDKSRNSPASELIYQEHDLVIRSIRDYFTPDIQEVFIDNREMYRRARDFFQAVMPRYHGRVKLYRDKKPLFAKHQVEEQIEAIYSQKVELKSGGSIVIDPTEALVAVDVNSGRATKEKSIEETAFKTNAEAAQEIARQLRLRDLGGLIVIDFIDMRNIKHIQEVEKTLRQAVKRDKARTQVSRISQFGLLELSRQRLKPTILEGNYLKCPHCDGTGLVKSTIASALQLLRRIRTEAAKETLAAIRVELPLDVAHYLLNHKRKEIVLLEEDYNLEIDLTGNPTVRSNEYSIEFIKRDFSAEAAPLMERGGSMERLMAFDRLDLFEKEDVADKFDVPESVEGRNGDEPPRLPVTRPEERRSEVVEPLSLEESVPLPVVATPAAALPASLDVPAEASLSLAVARGRVFWRLSAVSRRLELARMLSGQQGAHMGPRMGRGTSGRLGGRRSRGWWRRRSSANQPQEASGRQDSARVPETSGRPPSHGWDNEQRVHGDGQESE
jgi:ribonuclease E